MAYKFKKSLEVRKMYPQWQILTDIYHGNLNLKRNTKTKGYLHQFAGESNDVYDERKKFSVFNNFVKNEVDEVGQTPFRNDLIYNENFNKEYKKMLMENCDLKHTSFKDFLEDAFKFSVLYGVHAVFTDYFGERPFFESIKAPQIIGAWGEYTQEGEYRLKCFIFYKDFIRYENENNKRFNDYSEKVVRRVVKLTHPNRVEVFETDVYDSSFKNARYTGGSNTGTSSVYNFDYSYNEDKLYTKVLDKTIDSDKIPVELLFSDSRFETVTCVAPYYDIARMNLVHYNKSSSRDHILKLSAFPMIKATGVPQGLDRRQNFSDGVFAPNKMLLLEAENAQVDYIEPTGSAIDLLMKDIKELEILILNKSYEWLNASKNTVTATGSRIDESNKISHIKTLAGRVEEFSNKCLMHFADYASLSEADKENFKLTISTDFEYLSPDVKVRTLMEGYANNLISDEYVTKQLQRFEILPEDFDTTTNKQRLDEIAKENQEKMIEQDKQLNQNKQVNKDLGTKPREENSKGGSNVQK